VVADSGAERDFAIVGNLESAVVLCEAFVEPDRRILERVPDQQVRVFVKDYRERILSPI
jgi:hypothetical protein